MLGDHHQQRLCRGLFRYRDHLTLLLHLLEERDILVEKRNRHHTVAAEGFELQYSVELVAQEAPVAWLSLKDSDNT